MREFLCNPVKLAFTGFNFVATKVFLSLSVSSVLLCNWVVLTQRQFTLTFCGTVLGVNSSIVSSVVAQVTHQTNQLSFRILLCHLFTR